MSNKKIRQSNIELLRIVAMFTIVLSHCIFHGGFDFPEKVLSFDKVIWQSSLMGGSIGNTIFMLISGYFLINSNSIKIDKIIKLWISAIFYSVTIYLIFSVCGKTEFGFKPLLFSFFPVANNEWWFLNAYIIIALISPFINVFIHNVSKKSYGVLLIIMTSLWIVYPMLTLQSLFYTELLSFVYLYLVAGYIKLYLNDLKVNSIICFVIAVFMAIVVTISVYLKYYVSININKNLSSFFEIFTQMRSIPVLIISLSLFFGFKNLNIKPNRFINTVSSTMFGVYLIHANSYVNKFLWIEMFKVYNYRGLELLYIPFILSLIVLVSASFIDFVKINTIDRLLNRIHIKNYKIEEKNE